MEETNADGFKAGATPMGFTSPASALIAKLRQSSDTERTHRNDMAYVDQHMQHSLLRHVSDREQKAGYEVFTFGHDYGAMHKRR